MMQSDQSTVSRLDSFPADGIAVVVGANGGIGSALVQALSESGRFSHIVSLMRRGEAGLDITSEASVAAATAAVAAYALPLRLLVVASGVLHGDGITPEKNWRQLDPIQMARAFAVNSIGPALLMKHFLPLLPRSGKAVFAALSARVGSIGDNRLGGWYSYRASKAALNQIVRTASIELSRRQPDCMVVALHPGTVRTALSSPFGKSGLDVQTPASAAHRLLAVIDQLGPRDSGGFFDHHGTRVPW